jgi:flavin-dependent dehydrogenase
MLNATSQLDLAIVGGGPAGSSAAITAARMGAKVALFEARDFPRHKVCGEFVSAESLDLLAGLLRDVPQAASVFSSAPVLKCTRLLFGGRVIEAAVSPAALSITRYDLDALLWDAAQRAGVEVHSNCEVIASNGDGPFTLHTSSDSYSAKAVIVAAGRWSQFTADRTLPSGPKWIGVKGHFRELDASPSTDLYFLETGYCGVQPVAADVVNACAMVRSDCATSLEEALTLHPKLAERAAGWHAVTQPISTAPLVYREPQPGRGNIMFVGDAAAFIDPFAGDGISIALRSGRVAAECLGEFLLGKDSLVNTVAEYQREYSRQFASLISAAARVRSLFSLPAIAKPAVFELLRLPGLIPYVIRKTRTTAK